MSGNEESTDYQVPSTFFFLDTLHGSLGLITASFSNNRILRLHGYTKSIQCDFNFWCQPCSLNSDFDIPG